MAQFANDFRNGLAAVHQPRPWLCTRLEAYYCPIHGDCSCGRGTPGEIAGCGLHGRATNHPAGSVIRL